MLENALRDTASWLTTKWSSSTVFPVPAWVITNSKGKNLNQTENYHQCAQKMFWNACTWHELWVQTFYGLSMNLQEQSQNGLRLVTDVWQDWFHTFIPHTWLPTTLSCGSALSLGVVPRLRFCWRFGRLKLNLRRSLLYLWKPISWMCKKQTSISHSSTESEIISLDAGLRMDGVPAVDLWDVVIEVLSSTNNTKRSIYSVPGNWYGTEDRSSNKTKT